MLRWFFNLLYGAEPAAFESRYSVSESVSRLAKVVKPSLFRALAQESAVGTVTEQRVSIQRVIPLMRNSWKPFFIGSFRSVGTKILLSGHFTYAPSVKIFMSFWFGFLAIWTVLAAGALFAGAADAYWLPLFGVAMFAAGIGMVRIGKWFARNDVAWLSRVISEALDSSETQPSVSADTPSAARR